MHCNQIATAATHYIYEKGMPRGVPISDDEEATIKAALRATPHALLVARESRGAWSYATVWRVADRAGIPLTAGRETMGRRLSAEQRAAVVEARRNNPNGTQQEVARARASKRKSSMSAIRSRKVVSSGTFGD
jgi:hypothetical protein